MVADAEEAHFSASVKGVKSLGNLIRFGQRIRAVEKKDVQIIGLQPSEASLYRVYDVLF